MTVVRCLGAATAAVALLSAGASAQTGTETSPVVLEEIIVTAQKRSERLQDVPVSITALTAEALDRAHIDNGAEIARQTPNLRVSLLGNESQPKFSMRGISTPEFNLNAISPTGVFFDEVYIGASFLGGAQVMDLERIEVLRGPQGTLFGKNTTAGAVNFISKQPSFESEGWLTAGYGSYNYVQVKGAGEMPLVADRLTARVAFDIANSDGYIRNLNPTGKDLSNIDHKTGRLTLAYKGDDGVTVSLRLFHTESDADAIGAINTGLGVGGVNAFGVNPRVNPFTGEPLSRHQVVTDRSGDIVVRGNGGYLRLDKDIGFATITSITSHIRGRFLNTVDGDGSIVDLLHIDFASRTKETSQDLRIATNGQGPFQLITGLYYYGDDIDVSTTYRLFGGPPVFPVLGQTYHQRRRSYAAYADGTYDIDDAWSLYAGLRYTDDKGRLTNFQVTPIIPTQPAVRYHDGEPTGRFGVRYRLDRDTMIYTQYARGYRSSAINGGALTNPADLNVAEPEQLDSYETGLKSQWLDRLLTANVSGFLYKFRDQQFVNVVGIGTQQLVNAGRSRIYGLEAELTAHPTDRFSFGAGLGLLRGEYRELVLNGIDLAGHDLIEAPRYTINLSADYAVPIGELGAMAFHVDATHAGRQYFSALNTPEFCAPSFWDVNARIGFSDRSGRYELAVYGKNLTDNRVTNGIQIDPSTSTRFTTVPFPRRFGVEFTGRY